MCVQRDEGERRREKKKGAVCSAFLNGNYSRIASERMYNIMCERIDRRGQLREMYRSNPVTLSPH